MRTMEFEDRRLIDIYYDVGPKHIGVAITSEEAKTCSELGVRVVGFDGQAWLQVRRTPETKVARTYDKNHANVIVLLRTWNYGDKGGITSVLMELS